jgi:hypothetical protein
MCRRKRLLLYFDEALDTAKQQPFLMRERIRVLAEYMLARGKITRPTAQAWLRVSSFMARYCCDVCNGSGRNVEQIEEQREGDRRAAREGFWGRRDAPAEVEAAEWVQDDSGTHRQVLGRGKSKGVAKKPHEYAPREAKTMFTSEKNRTLGLLLSTSGQTLDSVQKVDGMAVHVNRSNVSAVSETQRGKAEGLLDKYLAENRYYGFAGSAKAVETGVFEKFRHDTSAYTGRIREIVGRIKEANAGKTKVVL